MNVLVVGGSDPSGAAGIQRDCQAVSSLGYHPLSVVTAVTAQNTTRFLGVIPVGADAVSAQLESVVSDFDIHAVKVGMVWNADSIGVVHRAVRGLDAPVVLDPVVRSTTGGALLEERARDDLLGVMVPASRVVTPNMHEASFLTGTTVTDLESAEKAASMIRDMGATSAVITGVVRGDEIVDVVCDESFHHIRGRRLDSENRGGGCTYSAALACGLAAGDTILESARLAREITYGAISGSASVGRGIRIVANPDGAAAMLASCIDEFTAVPGIAEMIPQCQTNFVYSPRDAVSPDDVLGVRGRIVRAGDRVVRVGDIMPGGSRHVASAVCAIRGRFPGTRAAVNLRYSREVLAGMVRAGFIVSFYDRSLEPPNVKESGSSVAWGVGLAAEASSGPPDAICHRGDFGKEPMTILFGADPRQVVAKVRRLCPPIK